MLGAGTTITFQSGYFAEILSMTRTGVARTPVPTTTFATTGGQTFVPSDTYDPGELVVEAHRDPSVAVPITAAAESITITWPTGAPSETEVFSGFLVDHEVIAQREEKVRETLRIKASGNITY